MQLIFPLYRHLDSFWSFKNSVALNSYRSLVTCSLVLLSVLYPGGCRCISEHWVGGINTPQFSKVGVPVYTFTTVHESSHL